MNNYFWLVLLPNLDCFLCTLGVVGIVGCVASGIIYASMKIEAYDEDDQKKASKFAKVVLQLFSISMTLFFITCFIPTKKDIIQLKIISVVSELKGAEQLPQKLVDRLNSILDGEKER